MLRSLFDAPPSAPRPIASAIVANAPTVNSAPLLAAFQRAGLSGLRRPRLTFGAFVVKLAPETGRNPGALYVTQPRGGDYLGKIVDGRFFRAGACTDDAQAEVVRLIDDPKAAIEAYGMRTGQCAICGLELTNGESIARGIGPICAEKWGF
ncbi:MAG: hypothetical protein KAX77_00860 [Xanthomonadales bacterium]|nr:hypothetical protein [Xanthomonadales bacterium]